MFQFPSNGKAYPKYQKARGSNPLRIRVSIPFKRESLSKVEDISGSEKDERVSIPFKRESLSKGASYRRAISIFTCVSIPFKRESLSKAGS